MSSIFLTCVQHHVALEEVVLAEAPGAEGASVGPGPAVDEHMTLEVAGRGEALVTNAALVGLVL